MICLNCKMKETNSWDLCNSCIGIAIEYYKRIYLNIGLQLHPTEEKYPLQTKRFREILDEMYQVHLKKNADYSPYNVNSTGIIGIMVRVWDKTARLMNLLGFDIATGNYTGQIDNLVLDEGIEDSFIDLSNYGIIGRIYLEGKWGK